MRLATALALSALCACTCGPSTPSCPKGTAACSTLCINLALDDTNCGSCGHVCPSDTACAGGECYRTDCTAADCATNQICLAEACKNRQCVGVVCPAGSACNEGACFERGCGAMTCADGQVCLAGQCIDPECRGVICPTGTACIQGACRAADCSNSMHDGNETDVDCGGVCAMKCAGGQRCMGGADCVSLRCDAGRCDAPSCTAGEMQPCGSSVGECRPGHRDCDGGTFGACVGAVGPTAEVCDGRDNDCDGVVDPKCDCPSGAWFTELIWPSGSSGERLAAAIDPDGGLHLSFRDTTGDDLLYAYHPGNGGFWRVGDVPNTGGGGRETAAAYDDGGTLHVVFEDTSSSFLRYAARTRGGPWTTAFIDVLGSPGTGNSIAVDSTGGLHVTTYDSAGPGELHYLFKPAGQPFQQRLVLENGGVGQFSSVAVSAAGDVAVAYYDNTGARQDLKLIERRAGQGQFQMPSIVDSMGDTGQYPSAAFDSTGALHVVYQDATIQDLRYAVRAAGAAMFGTPATLDASTNARGSYASLTVDARDGLHVVSADRSANTVRYGYKPSGGAWTFMDVDGTPDVVGEHSTVKVDAQLGVHVAYYSRSNNHLRYAYKADGATRFTVVGVDDNDVGQFASLALARDELSISYFDNAAQRLSVATRSLVAPPWSVGLAYDGGEQVGHESGIAVDGAGGVHISHRQNGGPLRYEYKAPGATGFVHQVANPASGSQLTAIAVTPEGEPFITQYDNANHAALSQRDGGTWVTRTIDGTATTGNSGSGIAMLPDGRPFIAYRHAARGHLCSAVPSGASFALGTIDTGQNNTGWSTTVRIGLDGLPRVLYYDASDLTLFVARQNAQGSWLITPAMTNYQWPAGSNVWPRLFIDRTGAEHVFSDAVAAAAYSWRYVVRSAGSTGGFSEVDSFGSRFGALNYGDVLVHPSGRVDLFYYDSAGPPGVRHRYRCP